MKTWLYVRVSTDGQDGQAQHMALIDACTARGISAPTIITDTASGSTPWRDRAVATVLRDARPGDLLLVTELSRLGRSTGDVLDFAATARKADLTVCAVRQGLTLDDSIGGKVMTTMLALVAELERDFVRDRTRQGMARAAARGARIGRPLGFRPESKVAARSSEILSMRSAGVPKAAIARLCQVSVGTITRLELNAKVTTKTQNAEEKHND